MDDLRIRPMTTEDLAAAERISDDAFYELDVATHVPGRPRPERRTPERSAAWVARSARFLESDPGGSWVAEDASGVVGFASSARREEVWFLATFAVEPGRQGAGIGAPLLEVAVEYGRDCPRWMLSASDDPRALRRYHRAGLRLHPQMTLTGTVDRSTLPAVSGVREGTPEDREWMDELDRRLRGGPHGPDHDSLADSTSLVVTAERSGYAYARPDHLAVLGARDATAARTLLWECLARSGDRFEIGHVTSANGWAVEIGLDTRLSLSTSGFLGLRGMDPPAPYVHHGALL
ncbi:GNAT family N-acetyltransferase [Nocardioides sp.]|nr:GNAT family N-acetyltransferase [Nocardioides sp.]